MCLRWLAEAAGVWPGTMAREFLYGSEMKKEASFTYSACNLFVIGCIMSRDHVFAEQDYLQVRVDEAQAGWRLESFQPSVQSSCIHCQPNLPACMKKERFIWENVILLFSEDALNGVKIFIILQKVSISNKRCYFKLYSSNNRISVSTKIWSRTTFFDIDDNQKCYLSIKSAY